MEKQVFSLILADDHEIFLDSLSAMLLTEDNLNIIGKVNNGKELIKVATDLNPDMCIVDIDMPVMNGLQASETLLKLFPDIRILILTMHKERSLIKKMMSIGVKGYLLKTCDRDEFIFAINQILKNKTYFSDQVIDTLIKDNNTGEPDSLAISKIATLSERELEIIQFLCIGLSNKQIAEKLYISPKTIDNHRTNIMHKLDVHNIVELVRFCLIQGLAD
jgi:two-component system response regulator NreC